MTRDDDGDGVLMAVEAGAATITLNRPTAMNAFDLAMAGALAEAVERCRFDESVRVVLLTGAGSAFCAGGDMRAAAAHIQDGGDPSQFFRDLTGPFHRLVSDLHHMDKAVIAAVNGVAAGAGMSLVAVCDYRIAAASARFKQAYTSMGLAPDGGWTVTVPAVVGTTRATEMLLVDRMVHAQEALAMGLVHEVVPDDRLVARAAALAASLAAGPIDAFAAAKRLMNARLAPDFQAQLERERQAIAARGGSEEFQRRLQRFIGGAHQAG